MSTHFPKHHIIVWLSQNSFDKPAWGEDYSQTLTYSILKLKPSKHTVFEFGGNWSEIHNIRIPMVTLPINANKYARQNGMERCEWTYSSPGKPLRINIGSVVSLLFQTTMVTLDKQEYFLLSCFIKVIPDEHKQNNWYMIYLSSNLIEKGRS